MNFSLPTQVLCKDGNREMIGYSHREELRDRVTMVLGGGSHPMEDLGFRDKRSY